jgi:hypothetical protein
VQDDWQSIRDRTLRVRAAIATGRSVMTRSPLNEMDVVAAERQFGVTLPDGYRQFLLHVDSGGPGPVDMRRLFLGDAGWCWENDLDTDLTALSEPFPDQRAFDREYAEFYTEQQPPSTPEDREAWYAREEELLRRQTSGAVYLGDEGHNFSILLVVSGPERGNVWFDRRATSDTIVAFRRQDGASASFIDLYLDWIEAAERLLGSAAPVGDRSSHAA